MKQLITPAIIALLSFSQTALADTQLERQVASELRYYGVHKDISTLTKSQIVAILAMMDSKNSNGEKRTAIKAIANEGVFTIPRK